MTNAIANLALLKTNWDSNPKRDYIENFVPFVVTLINRKKYDTIDANVLCKDFEAEFGLAVPYHPMIAIIDRARKNGYIVRKRGGRYVPVRERIVEGDFTDVAREQERKYSRVVDAFLKYCQQTHKETLTEDDAEIVFVSFLRDHDLDILFASTDRTTLLREASATPVQKFLIGSFITQIHESDPELFSFVVDISLGHVMANTLLYRDFDRYQGGLPDCNVYLDIGFLFSIVGINGPDRKEAYIKFIELLGHLGARVFVFRHTHEEFLGILNTCMYQIENRSFSPARASRSLIYFLDNESTASDIERLILTTPDRLGSLGVEVVDAPILTQAIKYQIDELELTDIIVNAYRNTDPYFEYIEKEYTVQRDVDSIAAIYKLRGGLRPTRLQDARHVFVTTNATLARSSRSYEVKNSSNCCFFIPAALTDVFVGTLLWIQSPNDISEVNERRFIADCYAALQPTRSMVKRLVDTAERLRDEGVISNEDVVLLKQSRVARNLLQEETKGDPNRFTDKTVTEILEEIRAGIRREEREALEKDREQLAQEKKHLHESLDERQKRIQLMEHERDSITVALGEEQSRKAQLESNIEFAAERIASIITKSFHWISVMLIVVTVYLQSVPDFLRDQQVLRTVLLVMAGLLSVLNLVTGFNVKGVGKALKDRVKTKIIASLRGRN